MTLLLTHTLDILLRIHSAARGDYWCPNLGSAVNVVLLIKPLQLNTIQEHTEFSVTFFQGLGCNRLVLCFAVTPLNIDFTYA